MPLPTFSPSAERDMMAPGCPTKEVEVFVALRSGLICPLITLNECMTSFSNDRYRSEPPACGDLAQYTGPPIMWWSRGLSGFTGQRALVILGSTAQKV